MSTAIDTRFIEVTNWTSLTATILLPYGTVPILLDPEKWVEWAAFVITIPAVAALGPPRPEGFTDWREWGRQFNVAARLLAT